MKKAVKQPFLWIAAGSLLLALVIAVVSCISRPEVSVIKRLEKGINSRNMQTVLSCFPPETQAMMGVFAAGDWDDLDMPEKVNLLSGPVVTDEDGNQRVHVFLIAETEDGIDLESTTFDLTEVEGKLYLSE